MPELPIHDFDAQDISLADNSNSLKQTSENDFLQVQSLAQSVIAEMKSSEAQDLWKERLQAFLDTMAQQPNDIREQRRSLMKDLEQIDEMGEAAHSPSVECHKGWSIDLSLSASEIQMKIDELEVRFDTLTEEELDVLFSYQDRLIDIERQQQAKNEAVIDAEIQETADSDERLKEKFEEISGFLDPDIRTKYPKLEEILSAWDAILADYENASIEDRERVSSMTDAALAYLKAPENRQELFEISRTIERQDPKRFQEFQGFLVSQDPVFEAIFEGFKFPQTSREANIAAALPKKPIWSSSGDRFYTQTEQGVMVEVDASSDQIVRSLFSAESDFRIQTPVLEVDLKHQRSDFDRVLQTQGPVKERLEQARHFLDQNEWAELNVLQDHLRSQLGEEYLRLGLNDANTVIGLRATLETEHNKVVAVIKKAKIDFDIALAMAIQSRRDEYKEHDEQIELTLKKIDYLWLGKLGLDWIIREIRAETVKPNLWSSFDPENIDLALGAFGQSGANANNPMAHLENLYRMANVIVTGHADGMVNGRLLGFSLDPNLMKSNSQPKTRSEVHSLLVGAGVWNETTGPNKEAVRMRLSGISTSGT